MLKISIIIIVLTIMLMLVPASSMLAQNYEVKNDRILAPEVSHFVGRDEPTVDAHGDLSLSIPLLTVPGRDGLDFEIVAHYRSGIQVTQSASWIGLGWSLDVGSITRHALGGIEGHPQTDWARAFGGQTGDIISQPDVYVVNMNGNSTILLSNTYETDRQIPFDPADTNEQGPAFVEQFWWQWFLVSSPWKPWKFAFDLENPVVVDGVSTFREDVKKIMIITEDGTRYVYGLPSLSEPSFPPDDLGTQIYKYVSTWRLTAILSPDYPYNLYAEEPNESSPGGWVKISYRTWDEINENEKIIDTISRDNPRFFAQLTFPYKIETPTHYAQFITSKRYDRDLAYLRNPTDPVNTEDYFHRKLDKIVLYKKALDGEADEKILEVSFTYMDNGAPTIAELNDPKTQKMLSKLALQEIKTTGFKGAQQQLLPGYKFSYDEGYISWYDITSESNPIYRWYTDDFGYYNRDPLQGGSVPDTDGPLWSLTKIVYPEGGCHVITYESDYLFSINFNYDYFNHYLEPNPNVLEHRSSQFKRNKQGGHG